MRRREIIKQLKHENHTHHFGATFAAIMGAIAAAASLGGGIASAVSEPDKPEVPKVKQTPEQTRLTSTVAEDLTNDMESARPGDLNYRPFGSIGQGLTSPPGSITERVNELQRKLTGQGVQAPDFGSIQPQIEDPFKKKQRFGLTGF